MTELDFFLIEEDCHNNHFNFNKTKQGAGLVKDYYYYYYFGQVFVAGPPVICPRLSRIRNCYFLADIIVILIVYYQHTNAVFFGTGF